MLHAEKFAVEAGGFLGTDVGKVGGFGEVDEDRASWLTGRSLRSLFAVGGAITIEHILLFWDGGSIYGWGLSIGRVCGMGWMCG